jgi:single-strand DNA-binding protein
MSYNKAILVGRLGKDPEVKFTSSGKAVANFSLATDESWKGQDGERKKKTSWHRIVVWSKQAEIAQQYLKKGSLVLVEGKIDYREWTDREGKRQVSTEIVCENFRMLGKQETSAPSLREEFANAGVQVAAATPISDEDIPF